MGTVWLDLAWLMAGLHLALILFLVAGGLLSLRWPRLVPAHITVVVAVATVFVAGADCPLTVWQKSFLERAGRRAYDGGFVEHHLLRPFTDGGMTPMMKTLVVATWVVPSIISSTILAHRWTRRPDSDTVTVSPPPT